MAFGTTLPPQAYTRETLAQAFNWLQSQPESIKRLAASPDALVGLFLRAQRFGNLSPEADAPVSSQHFVSDLKNLAEGLKQFEAPQNRLGGLPPTAPPPTAAAPPPVFSAPPRPTAAPQLPPQAQAPAAVALAPLGALNLQTQQMIHEVKTHLNLTSDAEVINMLVSLGYKSLKNLLS